MMMKKGQAAMEFLMTYGWAILVVLAAIGALAYLGVLSPSNLVQGRCAASGDLTCNDAGIDTNALINLSLIAGRDIQIDYVTISAASSSDVQCVIDGSAGDVTSGANELGQTATGSISVSSGESFNVGIDCDSPTSAASGDVIDADVTVSYTLATSNIPKATTISLKNIKVP